MRVVYLHQYFVTPQGSGGVRSYEMARRLVAFGHEVHVVTTDARPGALRSGWRETVESGIHVHWLPVPYTNAMSNRDRIQAFLQFAFHASKKAAALDPDVVFATSTPLTIAIPGLYTSQRRQVPLVFEVRDLWPAVPIALGMVKNPIIRILAIALERFVYRRSTHVVALSPGMRDGVISTGYPASQVTVIPNSCDFDIFCVDSSVGVEFRREHEWLGDRPLVVYTGTLGLVNDVSYLLHLAEHTAKIDPEVRFLIIGNGRELKKLRILGDSLGVLNSNVFMMDEVPKSTMPVVLSAATFATSTVLNLPVLWHNSANKFFDALAASRPIVINYEGWQAEIIRTNDIGLVLSPTDYEEAARSLISALRDKEWVQQAGARAEGVGRTTFDRDTLARQLCDILEIAVR